MEHTRRHARFPGIAAAALAALVGCGAAPPDTRALLNQAKSAIDSAPSMHFKLTSSGVSGSGAVISGGEGDMRRPAGFAGTLDVSVSGLPIAVQIVSYGGGFYVQLPTDSRFTRANPSDYGFGDPAALMDTKHGLSNLLSLCASPSLGSNDRLSGEELYEVHCTLPGQPVASLLTSADPSKRVNATFGISTNSKQLRRAVLTGPFFSKTQNSTFTVVLDSYGENVTVTAPPTG